MVWVGSLIGLELLGVGVDGALVVLLGGIVGADGAVEDGRGKVLDLSVVGVGHALIFGSAEALLAIVGRVIEHLLVAIGLLMLEVDDEGEGAEIGGIDLEEALGGVEGFGRVVAAGRRP